MGFLLEDREAALSRVGGRIPLAMSHDAGGEHRAVPVGTTGGNADQRRVWRGTGVAPRRASFIVPLGFFVLPLVLELLEHRVLVFGVERLDAGVLLLAVERLYSGVWVAVKVLVA